MPGSGQGVSSFGSSAVISKHQHWPRAAATSSTPAVAGLSRTAWFANKPAPLQNPFLFPPSSVVAATPFGTPRKEGQQPRASDVGSAPTYPDHYSPAGDKVRLCRELRRNSLAMTPRKLNGVLDCLEGVNRLQDQLIRARRELTNLAIFGNKHGREPQRGPANNNSRVAAALARSPTARRWKKNNKRRARSGTGGAGGASRRTAKRKQQRQRARERRAEAPAVRSPEVEIKLEQDDAIRAPLRDIAPPNRAMVQRLNWQK
ncbi:hypothetical protein PG984_015296 [Apiospora sp. TS-2023a]